MQELDYIKNKKPVCGLVVHVTTTVSQEKVDKLIIDIVVQHMEPFSVAEKLSFVQLVKGLQPSRTVMTRKTVDSTLRLYFVFNVRLLTAMQTAAAKPVDLYCDTAARANAPRFGGPRATLLIFFCQQLSCRPQTVCTDSVTVH